MSWCQILGPNARPPFVVTEYRANACGEQVPAIPSRGPCGAHLGEACRLSVHHRRERSTGPGFPIWVLNCSAHVVWFSLYPPGHVPHGRVALTPTTADGRWITSEPDPREHAEELPPRAGDFRGTCFEAAVDAAQGLIGKREGSAGSSALWWSTQGRRLERSLALLGMTSEVDLGERHAVSELLGVDLLLLDEKAQQVATQPGYRQRGRSICAVLAALQPGAWLADRLAECGHRRGLWGAPWRWDPRTRALRRQPYRLIDTRGSPS